MRILFLHRRQYGKLLMRGLVTSGPAAEQLLENHLAAINDGVGVPSSLEVQRTSWLGFALNPFPDLFQAGVENAVFKGKDAFLRKASRIRKSKSPTAT
jgi:hypothetical protein